MQTKPLDWKAISREMLRCFYVDKPALVKTLTKQANDEHWLRVKLAARIVYHDQATL